jgi:Holliday junction resolvase
MSLNRRNPRRDATEPAIVKALRAIGVQCLRLSDSGCPDLLAWRGDLGFRLIEVKTAKGKLTPKQIAFRASGIPFTVARTPDEALALFRVVHRAFAHRAVLNG